MGLRDDNQKASAGPCGVPQRNALLVDEYPENLDFYSTVLEAYGYRVRRCSSYLEGVRCLGDESFDFVIVSQGTPAFEGSWVLMRAAEMNPSLPVLVVARCLDMDCYLEAMQLGAMDYLAEPLTVWEIGRLLERHAQVRASRHELAGRCLVGQANLMRVRGPSRSLNAGDGSFINGKQPSLDTPGDECSGVVGRSAFDEVPVYCGGQGRLGERDL